MNRRLSHRLDAKKSQIGNRVRAFYNRAHCRRAGHPGGPTEGANSHKRSGRPDEIHDTDFGKGSVLHQLKRRLESRHANTWP